MPFPATESTLSASHLNQFLREKYGLGTNTTCKLLRTGMNHLYLVQDGEDKYVFRVYNHGWRTEQEISEEVRLLNILKDKGLRISYALPDKDDNFIQAFDAIEGVRYGVLFSFIPGKKIARFSEYVSYNAGRLMAEFHKATENINLKRISYNTQNTLIDPLQTIKAFFAAGSSEIEYAEQLVNHLLQAHKGIDLDKVRKGAVHLDIWFDNIHVLDDGTVALFDFDFCGNGLQAMDIGYFMYMLFFTHPDAIGQVEAKSKSFIDGYESVTPISDEEKRIIPIVTPMIILFYLSMQCRTFDTWSNIFLNEDHLKRFMAGLKRWMEYQGVVIG